MINYIKSPIIICFSFKRGAWRPIINYKLKMKFAFLIAAAAAIRLAKVSGNEYEANAAEKKAWTDAIAARDAAQTKFNAADKVAEDAHNALDKEFEHLQAEKLRVHDGDIELAKDRRDVYTEIRDMNDDFTTYKAGYPSEIKKDEAKKGNA